MGICLVILYFLILDRVTTGGSNERIGTFRYFIGYSGRDQHG
jgi:hypothetical protein